MVVCSWNSHSFVNNTSMYDQFRYLVWYQGQLGKDRFQSGHAGHLDFQNQSKADGGNTTMNLGGNQFRV